MSEGEASAQLAAEAVEFATAFVGSGSLVTTGTVRQQGAQLTYGPSPADALVVDVDGVPTATFQIEAMEGDLSSAANFLGGNHDFRYAVAVDDRIDMRFTSLRSSGSFETSAAGAMVVNALDLEVDVSARGTYFSEVDSTGSEFRNAFSTTGTVDGPGFELALDETWDFQLVTVSGADGGSAQSAVRTVDSSLTLGADTYDWVDVRTQKSYRDGRPSSLDTFWTAQGEVLRNGQAFGQYRLDVDLIDPESGGFILFMLDLPEDSYELERIAAY